MSAFTKRAPIAVAIVLFITSSTAAIAQTAWVRSSNSSLYYLSDPAFTFTWSGGGKDGYCHGYGTVRWYSADGSSAGSYTGNISRGKNEGYGVMYYPNGYRQYDGYWKNDVRHGTGTTYHTDGSVEFRGTFVNGSLENIAFYRRAASSVAEYIMDELFDGGINLEATLVKLTDSEVRIKIFFNGNLITTNEYRFTLVISDTAPFIDFINYNANAETYLTLRITAALIDEINKMFERE